ncbi:GAF domain-containing sensor histidine kinase [Aliterella atlantica]|uniref:histidine kinase n=1 Tax=Aliterella atlantica CENA595 TaxID=1618023 RepID=A0A0D9A0M5_9CYAN|nr:GAF domain-containing sensor histidine kinase [Aliterella atlantica]KJH73031.1 hypothetical protein UH38_02875 [Aliterella atlantica CENA595]
MVEPENRLVCQLVNSGVEGDREEQRLKALVDLGLLQTQTIPVFEEATQTAAELLDAPICILGFIDRHRHAFKAAVGLSRLGLMNKIAQERQLPRPESFCSYVVEQHQVLAIADTLLEADFAHKVLVQRYGIRAYLGVPLTDTAGNCLGSIAIMEQSPRTFTPRDIQCLELIARWSMSEFERQWLVTNQPTTATHLEDHRLLVPSPHSQQKILTSSLPEVVEISPDSATSIENSTQQKVLAENIVPETLRVKLELLEQIIQELRTPLTSVLGMATVLAREIYGPLMNKQKEYLDVIQKSGRYLLSLVNEISELGAINSNLEALDLADVDIEMLCQHVTHTLEDAAKRRDHQLRLFVERDQNRTWILDKEKVKQLLYHLIFNVIQSATPGSTIRIHVFQLLDKQKKITVSVSHPWLEEGLGQIEPCLFALQTSTTAKIASNDDWILATQVDSPLDMSSEEEVLLAAGDRACEVSTLDAEIVTQPKEKDKSLGLSDRSNLRLSLSYQLAQLHGGKISIELIPDSGYRYTIDLPHLEKVKNNN